MDNLSRATQTVFICPLVRGLMLIRRNIMCRGAAGSLWLGRKRPLVGPTTLSAEAIHVAADRPAHIIHK